MLHMAVNTHPPGECPFRSAETREVGLRDLERLGRAAREAGAELRGAWGSMSAHTFFLLIEAPDAHLVDRVIRDTGLVAWTETRIYPVADADAVVEAIRASG